MKTTFISITLIAVFSLSACSKEAQETNAAKPTETVATLSQPSPVPTSTLTPTPTPKPVERKDVRIIGLMIGTGLAKNNEIKNPTANYKSSDSIFAIVRTYGSGPDATIKVRCTDASGAVVFEESKKITPKGSATTPFTLAAPGVLKAGNYRLVGMLDDYPTMAVNMEVSN